jgi:hypothetical protein
MATLGAIIQNAQTGTANVNILSSSVPLTVTGLVTTQPIAESILYQKMYPLNGASQDLFTSKLADNLTLVVSASEKIIIEAQCKRVGYQFLSNNQTADYLYTSVDTRTAVTAANGGMNSVGYANTIDSPDAIKNFKCKSSATAGTYLIAIFYAW